MAVKQIVYTPLLFRGNSIKAIIFDFGGVVGSDIRSVWIKEMSKTLKKNRNIVLEEMHRTFPKLEKNQISEKEFWKIVTKNLKLTMQESKYENLLYNLYAKLTKPNKDVIDIVERLKNSGYTVAVLSNAIDPHVEYNMKHRRYRYFDRVFLSCEVGMRKPEKRFYQFALDRLDIKARKCIFIDNEKKFLVPAKKMGMKTIRFRSAKQLRKDLLRFGVHGI
jgi:putative hydrolase of the HAD superfamily